MACRTYWSNPKVETELLPVWLECKVCEAIEPWLRQWEDRIRLHKSRAPQLHLGDIAVTTCLN